MLVIRTVWAGESVVFVGERRAESRMMSSRRSLGSVVCEGWEDCLG